VLCFVVAGFIEAWVTPSGLPTWARVSVGVMAETLFLAYAFGLGRVAVAAGYTGRLGEAPVSTADAPMLTAAPST
jgi:hypothetical protein